MTSKELRGEEPVPWPWGRDEGGVFKTPVQWEHIGEEGSSVKSSETHGEAGEWCEVTGNPT